MKIVTGFIFLVLVGTGTSVVVGRCDNDSAPDHVRLECRISPRQDVERSGQCYKWDEDGRLISACDDSTACLAWTGMQLVISCNTIVGDDDLTLCLGNATETECKPNASWPFAVSAVGGAYECKWRDNGSLFANRSIVVDDRAYVVPSRGPYVQLCRRDIAPDSIPGFNCSVAQTLQRYDLSDPEPHTHIVQFNVLGARPIDLQAEVLWANHYPIDLHLSQSTAASNSTTLHSVELNDEDLVFVGDTRSVDAYMVITANSSSGSSTMCVSLQFRGVPVLFPDETLPQDVTVTAGQPAAFSCQAQTIVETSGISPTSLTVAFHVWSPASPALMECFNCTFSSSELSSCRQWVDKVGCSGLLFLNSSVGTSPSLRSHALTARWARVDPHQTGSKVVCAIAAGGITQWAHTATLTVTLTVTPATRPTPRDSAQGRSLWAVSSVVMVAVVVGVCALSLLLCYKHLHRNASRTTHQDEIPLAGSSLPSSGATTPTLASSICMHMGHDGPTVPAIKVSLSENRIEPQQNGCAQEEYRDSMDSGLDVNSTAEEVDSAKVSGSDHLLPVLLAGRRHHSLTDLQPLSMAPATAELRVYVSYSDSQMEWVRDTLLPLLHSFQPITVTDHEGHMIAGNVISEERLRLLRSADKVVVVVSPDYHHVEWCCYELQHAIQQSPGGEGRLIPILCDGCVRLPSTISTLHAISLLDPHWARKLRVAVRRHHRRSN